MMPINWWCKKRGGVSGWAVEPGERRYGKIDFIGWWNNLSIGWCWIGQWRWEDGIRIDKEITLSVSYRRFLLLESDGDGGKKRDIKLNKDDASRRNASYSPSLSALSGNKKMTATRKFLLQHWSFFTTSKCVSKKFACWFSWCRSQPLITRFLEGMLQAGRKMKFYDILNHSNEILFVCFCFLSFGPSGKCVDRE